MGESRDWNAGNEEARAMARRYEEARAMARRNAVAVSHAADAQAAFEEMEKRLKGAKLEAAVAAFPGVLGVFKFGEYTSDYAVREEKPVLLVPRDDEVGPIVHAVYGPALEFARGFLAAAPTRELRVAYVAIGGVGRVVLLS